MKFSPRPGIFEDIICYRICWDEEQNNLKINILLKALNEIAEGDCSYGEDSGCSKLNNKHGICDSCLAKKHWRSIMDRDYMDVLIAQNNLMKGKLTRIAFLCDPINCIQFPIVREILEICLEHGLEKK